MEITYDREVDAMYIKFSDIPSNKQKEVNEDIILDLDNEGNMVGLEILDATKNYGKKILNFNLSLLGDTCETEKLDYTTDEAAKILKINKETLLRKIRIGDLKAIKLGKSYRIPNTEINRLNSIT